MDKRQGSMNKPKPSIKIEEDTNTTMKQILIKIPAGNDVVESIVNVTLHHRANITVLKGSGLISDITFHNPVSHAYVFTLYGPFQMTSISGEYVNTNYGCVPSRLIDEPTYSSFFIFLTRGDGKVFGGVVQGKVKAACNILITATLSKKSKSFRGGHHHLKYSRI
ncbi:AT-hook motif nuclear-localized protein 17-like [Vicia villosa]|uniref:AT-hook motif nuclear-localized protein 17-like n=1 Tax=Vicia villosa TaxID=3911 RepID=UPI00273BB145|nr:AT-hook motif nuclear-localized protein 17-like [Vicia villosa]